MIPLKKHPNNNDTEEWNCIHRLTTSRLFFFPLSRHAYFPLRSCNLYRDLFFHSTLKASPDSNLHYGTVENDHACMKGEANLCALFLLGQCDMMMMAMSQVLGTVDQRCDCTLYVRAFLPGKHWTGISFTTNPEKWRITLCSLACL